MTARPAPTPSPRRALRSLLGLLACAALGAGPLAARAAAQPFAYDRAALPRVVADVEARTPYRFLYRDALVAGKTVTLRAETPEALLDGLGAALGPQGVAVEVDRARRQVLLTAAVPPVRARLAGVVVDAATGLGVPYASVVWWEGGALRGAQADEAGAFTVVLPSEGAALTASSVGYAGQTVAAGPLARVVFRLTPTPVGTAETIVTGVRLDAALDTAVSRIVVRRAAPGTAEPSVRRALEALPAVGVGPAFAEGPRVRGLRADGFEVLLDGVSILSPTHLFGLFDAFSPDALQPVAFHYDVAPARYFAPPGGTLAFATRSGPRTRWEGSAAAGNVAARLALGGPVVKGRASAFVAARGSLLGRLPFPGTADLLRTGLDAGRATSALPDGTLDPVRAVVRFRTARADFGDLHGKLDVEAASGATTALAAYAGGDLAESAGTRLVPRSRVDPTAVTVPVATETRWGARSLSLQHRRRLGGGALGLTAGASRYGAWFGKGDFAYGLAPLQPGGPPRVYLDTLGYRNGLDEARLAAGYDRPLGATLVLSAGAALVRYTLRYDEQAARAPGYAQRQTTTQADVYAEAGVVRAPFRLDAGVRAHRFATGPFVRLSPRLRLQAGGAALSAAVGYTRNHQFLHRLYLDGVPGASVWVLTTAGQPPTASEGVSGGVYARPARGHRVQVEAYARRLQNLRQHETNAAVRLRDEASVLQQPWLASLDGRARGLEALYTGGAAGWSWSVAYTLARMTLADDAIREGEAFREAGDRTHQGRLALGVPLGAARLDLTGVASSGTPNPLAYDDPSEAEELGPYVRLDAALRGARRVAGVRVEGTVACFNVLGRRNPWYRERVAVVDRAAPGRLAFAPLDVYDLGRMPSVELAVRW